jgi:hypothetical protein
VINEQPRQIEHTGHPGDDRDDMQRLDPLVHRISLSWERQKHADVDRQRFGHFTLIDIFLSARQHISASELYLN